VAIGDLNGDGRPDLVTANSPAGTLSVLLANGDGTFKAKTDLAIGGNPASVAIGDLNGDGRPDLAVTISASGTVSVLLGNGDGTFGAETDFGTGGPFVAIGDLNGDGKPDLAVASYNAVSVLLGNGDGTFGAETEFATGPGSTFVAIGDLNADGKPDLVTANGGGYPSYGSTVSVLLGNGNGTFGARADFSTGYGPTSVAIGDLNGDGKPDLAVANGGAYPWFGNTVSILLGNGNGTFAGDAQFGTGRNPRSVAIGDLNGDGKPDLVTANSGAYPSSGPSTVSVLLGNGNGTFGAETEFATGFGPTFLAIGDLNGDSRLDLVTANSGASYNAPISTVSVLLGNGDGTFGAKSELATGPSPASVAIGDLNGDGKSDLAVASYNAVSVLLGNGDGTFRAKTDYVTGSQSSSVAIGDLNGDGRLDLAVANRYPSLVCVLLGNGDGTFRAKTDFGVGGFPLSVAIGDLNGDGRSDLVTANSLSGTVSVLLGNGDGTFGAETDYVTGSESSSVAIGDLNGDGRPDLAVASYNAVSVLLGNGDGTFGAEADFASGSSSDLRSVAIGDLNADGKPDLAVASYNAVSVLLGNGDGTLRAETEFGTGSGPTSVVIGDLNADGKPDLAVANSVSSTVSVLAGNGDGTFGAKMDFGTGSGPRFVAIGDLNGDGKPDLAVANSVSGSVSVLLNLGAGCANTIAASAGTGGTITPSGNVPVVCGESQSFSITPGAFYSTVDVLVDGVSQGSVASYNFTHVNANHAITATFAPAFTITAASFDNPNYTTGDVATVTVALQSSRFSGSVQVAPVLTPHFGQSLALSPASVTLASGGSGQATFSWSVPTIHGQAVVDLAVTADAGAYGARQLNASTATVLNELSTPVIQAAQQKAQDCGTTAEQSCGDYPYQLAIGLIPFLGTKAGVDGLLSDECLAAQYSHQGRHVQSGVMWLATALDVVDTSIGAADDINCAATWFGCILEPVVNVYKLIPSAVSGAAVCWTYLLDTPLFAANRGMHANSSLGTDILFTWLPDSLHAAFATSDSLVDLVLCAGRSHLRIEADSTYATADSTGLRGAVVMRIGQHPMQCAAIKPGAARLSGSGQNATNAATVRLLADAAADSDMIVVFHRSASGETAKLSFAPFHMDSGGNAALAVGSDSTSYILRVDRNGDGTTDVLLYPGGTVVSVPSRDATQEVGPTALRGLAALPSPFRSGTTLRFRVAGSRSDVRLMIIDTVGRLVTARELGPLEPGQHTAVWDGRNSTGSLASAGVYFCRLVTAGGSSASTRVVLLK